MISNFHRGESSEKQNHSPGTGCRFSVYRSDFCRILFSRPDLWDLYEHIRLSMVLSRHNKPDGFAGSMEFVTVHLLLGAFQPLQAIALTLVLNARHLFYGIAMLDRYRGLGWKKGYLIFGLCDETFSIKCSAAPPEGVDRGWFYFFFTALNQLYWFLGATAGGIFGSLLQSNSEGLDFVMTALFVVIFLDHWLSTSDRRPALIGLGVSLLALLLFGADGFMIPAMVGIFLFLTALQKTLSGKEDAA